MFYSHKEIEKKWQKYWEEKKIFSVDLSDRKKKKKYILSMFPYPSGSGLHVGHIRNYTIADFLSRYYRFKNYNVLMPIGWDAFGLPAEQYAIQTNNHPSYFTNNNIEKFRKQLKKMGFSYDWNKEINTTEPNYYKWTQWIFKRIYLENLAKYEKVSVNWCEKLGTVLANEEIKKIDGKNFSERGNYPIINKKIFQWILKITDYAEELCEDLKELEWPENIKNIQKNWIGINYENLIKSSILEKKKKRYFSCHLKDWVFSRQRYWGEPIPIIHLNNGKKKILLDKDLPLILPNLDDFTPSSKYYSPLQKIEKWINVKKNGDIIGKRDINVMPQWAGSCWYYISFLMKKNNSYFSINSLKTKNNINFWLPVDIYIGGQEHATSHLLYSRFWHKILKKIGILSHSEPFQKLICQGMILGKGGEKMSKSKGNTISPDLIIDEYGSDALRVYEMFLGPINNTAYFDIQGVKSMKKWLDRIYNFVIKYHNLIINNAKNEEIEEYHFLMIKEINIYYENIKPNLVISSLMKFTNKLYEKKEKKINKEFFLNFLIFLNPLAPHLSEELWFKFEKKSISEYKNIWPDQKKYFINKKKPKKIIIQINGKKKKIIFLEKKINKEKIQEVAKKNIKKFLNNKKISKIIFIKEKIINFII